MIPVYVDIGLRSQRYAKLNGFLSYSKTASRCSREYLRVAIFLINYIDSSEHYFGVTLRVLLG